ncbi:MAG TPA: ATP-binding protein [Lentimicrobium sp.]|nr:ATP-binding protein [Lentimicrobium sp.]
MKHIKGRYRLPLFLFFSAVITGLAIVLIYSFIRVNNSPSKRISRFGIQLNERFDQCNLLLKQLTKNVDDPELISLRLGSKKLPKNTTLFVIKNDTLIFWSDNSIPFDYNRATPRILQIQNGFFQQSVLEKNNLKFVLLDLIRYSYPYQNDYLSSSYNPVYSLSSDYKLSKINGKYSVKDKNGEPLLYISIDADTSLSGEQEFVIYSLLILTLIFLIFSIYYFSINSGIKSETALFIVVFVTILFRYLQFKLNYPKFLTGFDFFSPLNYASSYWLPSIGDLFTNVLLFTILSFITFRTYIHKRLAISSVILKGILLLSFISILILLHYLSLYLIDTLIINSTFELNLSRILDFSAYSLIAYFIIAMILLVLFFTSYSIVKLSIGLIPFFGYLTILLLSIISVWLLFKYAGLYTPLWQEIILYCIFILIISLVAYRKLPFPHITSTTLLVLSLTFISTFCLYHNKEEKEHEERKMMALRLSSDQDKIAEYLYTDLEKSIKSDTTFYNLYMSAWYDPIGEEACINYLQNHYLNGYWSKFNTQITLCFPEKQLSLKPTGLIIDCDDYFDNIIHNITERTSNKTLHYVKDSYGASNYIARIPMVRTSGKTAYVIIEFTQKYVPKGLGYPELLLDKAYISFYDLSIYSYAIYSKGELITNVGEYSYSISEKPFLPFKREYNFFNKNGYNHLYHVVNPSTSIIISKKNLSTLDKLSPFTYQLIFHIIIIFLLTTVYNFQFTKNRYPDLKSQLQIMLVTMVLFASMIIGATTLHNIRSLNEKKNQDMLSEKAHSVLIELEHKLGDFPKLEPSQEQYLHELLTKFSQVFFSDLNLYTKHGDLLATSRPEIFQEGLRSTFMSPEAYNEIAINQRTFFVTKEQIGKYQYLSAYIPFRNKDNQLMAYINLPYFAREHELRQEISSFLVTFVNIYIILTAFAVFLSLLIGNYLTRPLKLIRDQFSNVKLDKKNEKISYNRRDELGNLINEYNAMLDKLAESVDKLSQTERESAWKEMARQIAHEIKNPLTPMKLSIQHLYKSWQDKAPDWENRLEKTTTSIIQQIDSLAAIASAFSDFAKFPTPSNTNIDLIEIIKDNIALFVQQNEFSISFSHPEKPCFVFADEKQLSRVMVNLLNNAIQSLAVGEKGKIEVILKEDSDAYIILIRDNGIGIPESQKPKIFSPNFTTKSGGTGLGLAMVKNIIDSANGSISFESDKDGTTFKIHLPAIKRDIKN